MKYNRNIFTILIHSKGMRVKSTYMYGLIQTCLFQCEWKMSDLVYNFWTLQKAVCTKLLNKHTSAYIHPTKAKRIFEVTLTIYPVCLRIKSKTVIFWQGLTNIKNHEVVPRQPRPVCIEDIKWTSISGAKMGNPHFFFQIKTTLSLFIYFLMQSICIVVSY